MHYALIQLVSEQTMPNVLAALALEPALIILLHTEHTKPQAAWIGSALRRAGLKFETELRSFSAAPDVHESGSRVRESCAHAIAAGLSPVINITGGTKLMSIGAFAATLQPRWPAVYVDTANRRFLPVGDIVLPEPLRDGWAALTRAERRLTVDVVAAAHGCEHVSRGEDPAPFIELAEHMRAAPAEEARCHEVFGLMKLRGQALHLLKTVDEPLPELPARALELAWRCGLLERRGDGFHLSCPGRDVFERARRGHVDREEYFAATRPLQLAQGFLSGGWWEVCVWHAAKQSGALRDLRWSVRFGGAADHVEEDIVGVSGLNLAVMSCKRGGDGARLTRAFEQFIAAANRLGGTFAEKYFCVALRIAERHFTTVRTEALRQRVRLVGPASRLSPSDFVTA